jgi:hypothetical protein
MIRYYRKKYLNISTEYSVADPDPVGPGPFFTIRNFHHQIRIRIQFW